MADTNSLIDNPNTKNGNFLCGVVEGFYGRPWTTEQRKDLFQKLQKWGMDSYLYAPKDDYKHRAYWRELYTVEEGEHLTGLIAAAKENNITFYYALSPGLDITFSAAKEMAALKRKLKQVSQFGCVAFALLFDDIEPEMSEADKEVFQSFAHAQVSVTNEVYQSLNQPKFLFCPTQYCAARAMPNVKTSEYLNTIGGKLATSIDIMWTGSKVITKVLTLESIEEITEVLRRPPVIWDNLHANDYDQKRVFLGPYSGRSPELISRLRGVLTNPNCEYGANFVAIHTLAQWSHSNSDGQGVNDSVSADVRLETEGEDGSVQDLPCSLPPGTYHPRHALHVAVNEWLHEFKRMRSAWGPITRPQVAAPAPLPIIPSVNTCMSVTSTTNTVAINANQIPVPALLEVNPDSLMAPIPIPVVPVMNSLVVEDKVICNDTAPPTVEPMDCNPTPPSASPAHLPTEGSSSTNSTSSEEEEENSSTRVAETVSEDVPMGEGAGDTGISPVDPGSLTADDLMLLCDLFYLPFEHGHQGLLLLQEFNWLKMNAQLVTLANRNTEGEDMKPEVQEWYERARRFEDLSKALTNLFTRLTYISNRELLYDLYPYVWDMRGVVSLLNTYVQWLARGHMPQLVGSFVQGNYTWFSKGWKEAFVSGDQEPWVFRGGLTADLQRLIPVDSGNDLFVYKAPEIPTNCVYTIRPYLATDESSVLDVCRCVTGGIAANVTGNSDLLPDLAVGAFLRLAPEFCFVVEDENRLVGFAVAALDAKQFYSRLEQTWLPEMRVKYPLPEKNEEDATMSAVEQIITSLHNFSTEVPEAIHSTHPSVLRASLLPCVLDQSVSKRMITCLLAALRANGSFGSYTEINSNDKAMEEFYEKLGFVTLPGTLNHGSAYWGRAF